MEGAPWSQEFLPTWQKQSSNRAIWDEEWRARHVPAGSGTIAGGRAGVGRAGTFSPPWVRGPGPAGAGCRAAPGPGDWS